MHEPPSRSEDTGRREAVVRRARNVFHRLGACGLLSSRPRDVACLQRIIVFVQLLDLVSRFGLLLKPQRLLFGIAQAQVLLLRQEELRLWQQLRAEAAFGLRSPLLE